MGNMKQPIQLVKGWVKRSLYSDYEAHKTLKYRFCWSTPCFVACLHTRKSMPKNQGNGEEAEKHTAGGSRDPGQV